MSPKQKKLAAKAPPPNKLDGKDFAVLRAEKAKGRGMGLQDEKVKPGKVMKAKRGMFSKSPISGVKLPRKGSRLIFSGYSKPFEGPQHKGRVSTIVGVKPNATIRGQRKKFKTLEEMRKAKGFKTIGGKQETPSQFNKRRAAISSAKQIAKSSRIGKIALGVAAAGIGAKKYLESKMNKKDVKKKMVGGMMKKYSKGSEKKLMTSKERAEYVKKAKVSLGATAESLMDKNQPKKRDRLFSKHGKMAGGMASKKQVRGRQITRQKKQVDPSQSPSEKLKIYLLDKDKFKNKPQIDVSDAFKKMGGGMMQKPMGYDIGGGVSKAKEHKKKIKDKAGTILGYAGEMAKTLSKATPVGATKDAASIILAKVKEKKEAKTRRGKIIERLKEAPRRFPKIKPDLRGKPRPLPLTPDPRTRPKRMPGNPNKPPKYMPLRSGGTVTAKCKLGRNKPTKMY